MMILPDRAQEICEQQGWDDQSLILHLLGFIASCNINPDAISRYFEQMAEEERDGGVKVGTHFSIADLPDSAFTDNLAAQEWLARHRNSIEDRMAEAGNLSIETLLAMDGLPTDDEDED